MADDLVAFLRARLDKDEQTAQATMWEGSGNRADWSLPASATVDTGGDEFYAGDRTVAAHIARHDPARVLRGVDAKRRAVDEYAYWVDRALNPGPHPQPDQGGRFETAATMAKALAAEWSDHPDYREEWRP